MEKTKLLIKGLIFFIISVIFAWFLGTLGTVRIWLAIFSPNGAPTGQIIHSSLFLALGAPIFLYVALTLIAKFLFTLSWPRSFLIGLIYSVVVSSVGFLLLLMLAN